MKSVLTRRWRLLILVALLPLAAGATIWSGATETLDEECYVNLNSSEPIYSKKYMEPDNSLIEVMHIVRGLASYIGYKARRAVGYRSEAYMACEESFVAGNAESGYWLGEYLLTIGEEAEAKQYYEQSAEMGNARALYALGALGFFWGKFDIGKKQGFAYIIRAAEKGLMQAERTYGGFAYTEYSGIAKDQVGVFRRKMLFHTAKKGDFDSMLILALLYLYSGSGDSCLNTPGKSNEFMERSRRLNAGLSIVCDEEQGLHYLTQVAESGMVPEAILDLANYYEAKGETEQALYWHTLLLEWDFEDYFYSNMVRRSPHTGYSVMGRGYPIRYDKLINMRGKSEAYLQRHSFTGKGVLDAEQLAQIKAGYKTYACRYSAHAWYYSCRKEK